MGGDKGKANKVLVFASGIRKVFGHPLNWGDGKGCRGRGRGTRRLGAKVVGLLDQSSQP